MAQMSDVSHEETVPVPPPESRVKQIENKLENLNISIAEMEEAVLPWFIEWIDNNGQSQTVLIIECDKSINILLSNDAILRDLKESHNSTHNKWDKLIGSTVDESVDALVYYLKNRDDKSQIEYIADPLRASAYGIGMFRTSKVCVNLRVIHRCLFLTC